MKNVVAEHLVAPSFPAAIAASTTGAGAQRAERQYREKATPASSAHRGRACCSVEAQRLV